MLSVLWMSLFACEESEKEVTYPDIEFYDFESAEPWFQATGLNYADGTTVVADEAYLRESILKSSAKVVAGYPPTMPPYETIISKEQADQLIAFLKQY